MRLAMLPCARSSLAETSVAFNNLKIYDVYICFHGAAYNCQWFVDHLYSALVKEGISTLLGRKFTDDDGLSDENIRRSRICIPLFSKTFVLSQSFLKEVHFMVKSKVKVVPLFYDILPSDVRHQDSLKSEFSDVRRQDNLESEICKAVEEVSWRCGWSADQYKGETADGDLISDVVRDVGEKLEAYRFHLDTPKCFGLDWRVYHVRRLLNLADYQRKIVKVGIYGIVGMGKTTLAKVVCKSVCYSQFEVHCFVLGVGERCKNENGLVKLQTHMLKEVKLQTQMVKGVPSFRGEVDDIDKGKRLLRESLRDKRVLLLLDDIQSAEQVEALGANFTDFGAGSRLLITSQNQQILRLANVDEMCEVRRLPQEHAMELFKFHAFPNSHCADPDLESLSRNVVNACEGHPLSLQLLGKNLVGEDDRNVWKDMAEKLRDDPCMQKKLRASFDTLDAHEKEMFQDIACFLTGEDKAICMTFWADLKWNSHASLAHLLQKSFLSVGPAKELLMHRCLRDWGTTVANEVSTNPHKRTRLFDEEDAYRVLRRPWEKAKTLRYLRYEPKERKTIMAVMLKQLYNLRLLWLANVELKGEFPEECYFDELRWIRLRKCSLTQLPPGMNLKKLVILEVTDSHITRLWDDENSEKHPNVLPEKLKVLILRRCKFLEKIPDTNIYTQLQILDLHECQSLRSLPKTVENFHSLVSLNMKGCAVSYLPHDFGTLSSLEDLNLSCCENLVKLPASFGNLTRLERLEIHHNPNLRELPDTIGGLKSLAYLDAGHCQLCENGVPVGTFELSALRIMILEHNRFRSLPCGFQKTSGLWELYLDECSELSELLALPPSLEMLFARDCKRLEKLCCLSRLKKLCILDLSRSCHLTGLPGLESLQGLTSLKLVGCTKLCSPTLGSCLAALNSLQSIFIAGPALSSNQLLSLYAIIKAISFKSQYLTSGRAHDGHKWVQAEANEQNMAADNCFGLCAFDNDINYCAGYIVCCISAGQCEGKKRKRLWYSIERNESVRGCEMIHSEMDGVSEYVLEMRVVRTEADFDFKWLRMGDKLRVSAGSDHETWKACFKFLMYEPLNGIYPYVEEKPPHTITFGV